MDRLPQGARSGGRDRLRHVRLAGPLRGLLCEKQGNQFRVLHDELPMAGLLEPLPVLHQYHLAAGQSRPDLGETQGDNRGHRRAAAAETALAGGQLLQHEARGHHHQHEFRTAETLRHGRHRHLRELQRHPLSGLGGRALLVRPDRQGGVHRRRQHLDAQGQIPALLRKRGLRLPARHGIGDGFLPGLCLPGQVHLAGGDRHLAPPALRRRSASRRP